MQVNREVVVISREQADEVAEAMLEPYRRERAMRQKKKRARQRRRQCFQFGFGGFCIGAALGDYFAGDAYPWSFIGLVIGLLLVALFRRLPSSAGNSD